MRELMVFEGNEVEVFELGGKVLFNPKDVCRCLEITNDRDAISSFTEKQKVKLKNSDVGTSYVRKLNNAGETFLTESGVYKLIFKSRKVNAERFQDWITDEVLPQMRETGRYDVVEQKIKLIEDEEERMLSLAIYQLGNYVQANPTDIIASVNLTTKKNELTTYLQGKKIGELEGELRDQGKRIENFTIIGDRKQFTNEVNSVARATGKQQNEIYGLTYKELEDEYGISLEQRSRNLQRKIQNDRLDQGKKPLAKSTLETKASKLNVADEEGLWNELGKSLFAVKNRLLGR